MVKVLFVCLGNICRSPTAEGVFRKLVASRGLEKQIHIDSAGTSGWHVDEPPDPRAREEARRRGINLNSIRSRQVAPDDFEHFDYVVAMDGENLQALLDACPAKYRDRIFRCTAFAPELGVDDVPDPYYGGVRGFERVFDIIEASARGLLEHMEQQGQIPAGR